MTIEKTFPEELELKYLKEGVFELISSFVYNNPPVRIEVEAGFQSDGASIPQFAYSLIGGRWTGKYVRGAVVHDFLYSVKITTRKKADKIFLDAMTILGVAWWRRKLMYIVVRIFGRFLWKQKPSS